MPLVSVFTTAYNAELYIAQCIESVQAQTLAAWEMIIIDDASTDATAQVVQRYLDDPRIRLLQNRQNLGPAGGRNRALEAAQGEWVAILDADDWYEPTRLEHLLQTAQELKVAIIYDFCRWVSSRTGESVGIFFSAHMPKPSAPTRLSPAQAVQAHLALKPVIRREVIVQANLRYREDITLGEDYLFQTLTTIEAGGCGVLPLPLYNYRRHPDSTYLRKFFDLSQPQKVYETLFAYPKVRADKPLLRALRQDYRRTMLARAYPQFAMALKRRDWRKASEIYRAAPFVLTHLVYSLPRAVWRRIRGENTDYDWKG